MTIDQAATFLKGAIQIESQEALLNLNISTFANWKRDSERSNFKRKLNSLAFPREESKPLSHDELKRFLSHGF